MHHRPILSFLSALLFCVASPMHLAAQNRLTDSLQGLLQYSRAADKADLYRQLGNAFYDQGDFDKSLGNYKEALSLYREKGDPLLLAHVTNETGIVYYNTGRSEQAIGLYNQALRLYDSLQNDEGRALVRMNLGNAYLSLGSYEKALGYYSQSLDIYEKTADQKGLPILLMNIGNLYYDWGKSDKALDYYRQALGRFRTAGNHLGMANSRQNIGLILEQQGDLAGALSHYRESMKVYQDLGNLKGLSIAYNNIGNIFRKQEKYVQSAEYLKIALSLNRRTGDAEGVATALNDLGKTMQQQGKMKEAGSFFSESLEEARRIKLREIMLESYKGLYEVATAGGNYREALDNYLAYSMLKDSVFTEKSHQQIAEMMAKYELEKKENTITLLTRQQEIRDLELKSQHAGLARQKTIQYFLIAFVVLILAIGYLIFRGYRLKQDKMRADLQKQNLETETRLLRVQMNPHFLFNSLNSIQGFIADDNTYQAGVYLSKFAELMRHILENSRRSYVLLADEIRTLELQMEIENLRFDEAFEFSIAFSPGLNPAIISIPPVLIQPYVENAINHGLRNMDGKGRILLGFGLEGNLLVCTIQDNGIGRERSAEINRNSAGRHRSLGMQVARERLERLEKQTGQAVTVEVTDLKDDAGNASGTRVQLRIPFSVNEIADIIKA